MSEIIIGVDLGGTRLRAARLDPALNILEREATLTLREEGPEPIIARMIDLIQRVWPQHGDSVVGIGVSSPGPLDPVTGVVLAPTNLPDWYHVPLAQRLRDAFAVPAYVGNDANVAVLAEVARGAAQGCDHAIFITLSTGIGAGIMVDSRLLLGHRGLAAEIGSMTTILDGEAVYLESVGGGPGLAKLARKRIEQGGESRILALADGDLDCIDAKMVGEAARSGDTLALAVIEEAGRLIGLALASLLHLFNPEILVIGGSVAQIGDILFDPIHAMIREHSIYEGYLQELRIVAPALGEDVSLIGAAALVRTAGGMIPLLDS